MRQSCNTSSANATACLMELPGLQHAVFRWREGVAASSASQGGWRPHAKARGAHMVGDH
eukprot:CAMPEP_0174351566 /NCGR_PEP_ID=MMETSP0811_2-20130205/8980_1 /TAXON_ID=73025 ORGANISM="Eutreptiella gymnastica-like, Strain CCMP1594" /NCGR_SAMPLE_ID=MMETSP0811_2 /ASSEMBLY_ACC=CAM_ASM_000667 /LENGTH=58 /DNA_ID=CAMNT_0015480937 /DNA_START=663 /DNA_END=839 /DNA_ORIENTATION=+